MLPDTLRASAWAAKFLTWQVRDTTLSCFYCSLQPAVVPGARETLTDAASGPAGAMCNAMDDETPRRTSGEVEVSAEQLVATFGSPMHAAAILGKASDIAALSAAGHDVQARDKAGRTPCHVAAISGNLQNLQAVITAGAQLEVGAAGEG